MIINYNSLSSGRDAWLKNDVGEGCGSPPSYHTKAGRASWLMGLLLLVSFLLPVSMFAQTPANYGFASSAGTYTPLTVAGGATALSTAYADDVNHVLTGLAAFTVNGVSYTNYQMNSNGRLSLYTTTAPTTTTNYTPLSSTTGLTTAGVVIAPFGVDLGLSTAATSAWYYQAVGSELVFQWENVSRYSLSGNNDVLNFQVRLDTTTGNIRFVYGTCTQGSFPSSSPQVGFRTSTTFATDVNNLTINTTGSPVTCDWSSAVTAPANSSTMYFASANAAVKPNSGLTYTWTKQTAPAPVRTFAAVTGINFSGATVSWTAPTGATQYNVQYRVVGSCGWTNWSGNPVATNSVVLTGLTELTKYQVRVQASNGTATSIYSHIPTVTGTTSDGYNATGTFSTPAACQAPASVTAVPTTTTAANLSWPASGSAPTGGYQWEVRSSGAAGSGATGLADSGSTAAGTLTATTSLLTANTSYTLYVRANCESSVFSGWTSVAFVTPCNNVNTYPYVQGFNAVALPSCVTATEGATGATYHWEGVTADAAHGAAAPFEGSHFLRMNYFNASTTYNPYYLNLPAFELPAIVKRLRFNVWMGATSGTNNLVVEVSTNGGSTWTAAATYTANAANTVATAAWEEKVISLAAYAGSTIRIRYKATSNFGSGFCNIALDNLNIEDVPSCLATSSVTVANVAKTSATISWLVPTTAPENGYQYEVRTSGTAGSGATGLVASGDVAAGILTANVTGLAGATAYTAYVRSHCAGTDYSSWTPSSVFTTPAVQGIPWTEGFAATTLPTGWVNTSAWTIGSARGVTGNPGNNIYKNLYDLATTGIFNTANYGPVPAGQAFSFDYKVANYDSPYGLPSGWGSFLVQVSTNYGSTWNTIDTVNSATAGWNSKTYLLSAYTGQDISFRISATWTAGDYDLAFDNFSIATAPTCTVPTAFTATPTSGTTATISWTAPSTPATNGYEYEVRTSGLAGSGATGLFVAGTTASGVTTADITGLVVNTSYSVYVRAHCAAADYSNWTSAATFTAPVVQAVPYTQEFSGTTVPANWTSDMQFGFFTGLEGNPGNTITQNLWSSTPSATFTTVSLGPIVAGQILAFDYAKANYDSPYGQPALGSGGFVVSVSTDFGATYATLETVTNDAVAGWRTKSYPLTSYVGKYIKVKVVYTRLSGDYNVAFDNFKVSTPCDGTPVAGAVVPAFQSMCTGTPALPFNVNGASTTIGITYQWEQSTNGGSTWVNAIGGSGATASAFTPPNFAGTTIKYRLKVTCSNSGLFTYSDVAEINANPKPLPLHENFSDLNTLGGWTVNGAIGIGSNRGATGNPGSNAFGRVYSGATAVKMTSPNYGLITAGTAFSFDLKLSNYASPYGTPAAGWGNVVVEISTDCGGSFTPLSTITTFTGTNYVNYKYDLSAYVGSAVITRLSTNWLAGDFDVSIDNWSIDVPAPQIAGFTPANVCFDGQTTVALTGYAFTGATAVMFNGVNAVSFTVNSDTSITAVAPAGLATGNITITSAKGTGTSANTFTVTPSPIVAPITNGGSPLCVGESVDLDNVNDGGVWASLNTAIATVDDAGIVTAVSGGTVGITYTVTDFGCSTTVTSNVTVNNPVTSSNPVTQTVVTGSNAVYSVTATGDIVSYQWRVSTDGGNTFSALSNGAPYSGVDTATLTITGTPAGLNGNFYQVYITAVSPCQDFESSGAKLNVGDTGITLDPANAILCSTGNGTATFAVMTSGTVNSYVWKEDRAFGPETVVDGTFDGITYSGATTNTLTVSGLVLENSGWIYQVNVVGPANTAESNTASLTINEGVSVDSSPADQTVCGTGGSSTFTVAASGGVSTIQWQYSADGTSFSNVVNGTPAGATYTNADTATLTVATTSATLTTGTYYYQALVSGTTPCLPIASAAARLNVFAPAISSQPANAAAYTGTTPTFTVVSTTPGATYQWQYATALAGPYENVANATPAGITYTGADTATLSVVLSSTASASVARYYRAVVTAGGCSSNSTGAQLSISAYCAPTSTNAAMSATNGITNVVISNVTAGTNLTQASSAVAPWYALYTDTSLNVVQGQSMSVAITFGSDATQHSAVWIDYNRNGGFEADENVGISTAASVTGANGTKVYTFEIPYTAATGITRMRIRGGANAVYTVAGACTPAAYGETEDYVLNISTAPACSGNPVAGTAVSSVSSVCQSGSAVLTASGFSAGVTGITMQWHNTITGPISAATSATYTTPVISQNSSYFLRVTCASGGFSDTNIVTVTVNNPQVTASTGAERCGTGTAVLNATGSAGTTLGWYAAATGGAPLASGTSFTTPTVSATTNFYVSAENIGAGTSAVGAGASIGSAISYNLTNGSYGGFKGQYLITAAELSAAGIKAGSINSVAFEVTSAGATLQGFTVQMGTTALTTFPTPVSILGGLSTVVNNVTVTPVVGVNTLPFSTPFNWDGTSNIVVSTSWSNANTLNTSSTIRYDVTTNYSSQSFRVDSATAAAVLAATGTAGVTSRSLDRPKLIFGGSNVVTCSSARTAVTATVTASPVLTLSAATAAVCTGAATTTPITITSTVADYDTYVWSPATGVSGTAATGYTFNPATTTTYTLTANNAAGCGNTATVVVTVNPLPAAIVFAPAAPQVCSVGAPVLVSAAGSVNTISGGCLTATSGVWPTATFTPVNNGVSAAITSNGYAGEYSNVNVLVNYKYVLTSSGTGDYITVSNAGGTTILASGPSPITFVPTASAVIRFYTHTDAVCGEEEVNRSRSISSTPIPLLVYTPVTGLYTDAAGTVAYTGTAVASVYAKPATTTQYTGTVTTGSGCSASAPVTVTVNTATAWYVDADNDNYGNSSLPTILACTKPALYAAVGGDCKDNNAAINPGVAEIPYDGIDNNCDGNLDEGFTRLTTTIAADKCGTKLEKIYNSINAANWRTPLATGYRFKVVNLVTQATDSIDRPNHYFSFNQLPHFEYATSYAVSVQIQRNGIWLGYYGSACTITTPDLPKLEVCGGVVASKNSLVRSQVLLYVTNYRFEVKNATTLETIVVTNGLQYFSFNQIPGYVPGALYRVRVSVKTTGDWSDFGDTCTITAPGGAAPEIPSTKVEQQVAFKVAAYPNPYADAFGLDITTASNASVNLKVYDMLGKLIEVREVSVADLKEQRIGDRYSAGVYNIIVTQEENVKTLRVIKR